MKYINHLNSIQAEFTMSLERKNAFIGSRQIGKTTCLANKCAKVFDHEENKDIKIMSPTYHMTMELLEEIKKRVSSRLDVNLRDMIVNEQRDVSIRAINNLDGEDLDYLFIDGIDMIKSSEFKTIVSASQKEKRNFVLNVAGTSVHDSKNIKYILDDDSWRVFHMTMEDSPHIDNEKIERMRKMFDSLTEAIEVDGMMVTDPSEDADFTFDDI